VGVGIWAGRSRPAQRTCRESHASLRVLVAIQDLKGATGRGGVRRSQTDMSLLIVYFYLRPALSTTGDAEEQLQPPAIKLELRLDLLFF
jgi:hypothetical protein